MDHARFTDAISRRDGDFGAAVVRIQNTGDADADYPLNHGLGRIPIGCTIQLASVDCRVYKGSVWNEEKIYLKFTASNADVNIRIW